MRTLFCFLLLASSASAQSYALSAPDFVFPYSDPINVAFELRTAADDVVRWELAISDPRSRVSSAVSRFAFPGTAGLDFNAWAAAFPDTAFNRVLVTINGVTQEQSFPWSLHLDRRAGFDLDRLDAGIIFPDWPHNGTGNVRAWLSGVNVAEVPEPATAFMLLVGLVHLMGCKSRERR